VGGAVWEKYSFLDSVSVGAGVNLDQTYSCKNGGNNYVFPHKLIIEGNPESAAPIQAYTETIRCNGLQSGSFRNYHKYYDATCHDKSSTTFVQDCIGIIINGEQLCFALITYSNGDGYTYHTSEDLASVNNNVGQKYCASWEK
jgi:hypothetical protein